MACGHWMPRARVACAQRNVGHKGKHRTPADQARALVYKKELRSNTLSERRRRQLQELKLAFGCTDCGYKDHAEALQFDHLPQYPKSFNLSQTIALSRITETELLDELAKCEVVCANCHAIRTAERRG